MPLSPGLQQLLKMTQMSTSFHHLLMLYYLLSSFRMRLSIFYEVYPERRFSFWYLMKARQRCSKSCGTMYRTKLVKLQLPYRSLRIPSNYLPLRSQISSKSQSYWQMSSRFSSFTRSYYPRISAKIAVSLRALDSGHSSKVKRETSTLLRLAELSRSPFVIFVELIPATADLPLGVMNLSSSQSKQGPFFFLLRDEKYILVCLLYLPKLLARLNHRLNASKSQGKGNRFEISQKKQSFFRSPLIRQRFFISCPVITPSAPTISKRSIRFLYCMFTVFLKVSASNKFWIQSSSIWQNFFFKGYSSSLVRSGISPSYLRKRQKSSNLSAASQPHLLTNRSTPLPIRCSWLELSSGGRS